MKELSDLLVEFAETAQEMNKKGDTGEIDWLYLLTHFARRLSSLQGETFSTVTPHKVEWREHSMPSFTDANKKYTVSWLTIDKVPLVDSLRCTCPDATIRGNLQCKHVVRARNSLLYRIGG